MASRKEDKDAPRRVADETGEAAMGAAREMGETGSRMAGRAFSQAADLSRQSSEQLRSLVDASARAYGGMTDLSRHDMDALMQSGSRLAKGMQDMGWEMMQFAQNSFRMSVQCANEMMGCRSVEDMMQVQRNFMRETMGLTMQESARLMQLSSSLASDAAGPISQRAQEMGRH